MTTKTLDDVMRRVMNDSDVFYISYTIFDEREWKNLGKEYAENKLDKVTQRIEQKVAELRSYYDSKKDDTQKKNLQYSIELTNALKSAINNKPHFLKQMFLTLDKFGIVRCNLPNMEDYGKVIENHSFPIVEQFFLYKIEKAKKFEKKALGKTLEYLKELYAMNLDILEIAFFIRKLNSLTEFMEVIKDE
ncbi:hypothetical protein [Rosettibacter firmus]|uniref:hypothetical protein n=1 Tax=Rosettibacter firmus TaxID=3111522 RepID=UPI00336C2D46